MRIWETGRIRLQFQSNRRDLYVESFRSIFIRSDFRALSFNLLILYCIMIILRRIACVETPTDGISVRTHYPPFASSPSYPLWLNRSSSPLLREQSRRLGTWHWTPLYYTLCDHAHPRVYTHPRARMGGRNFAECKVLAQVQEWALARYPWQQVVLATTSIRSWQIIMALSR